MKLSVGLHTLSFCSSSAGAKITRDVLGTHAQVHCGTCVDSRYLKIEAEFKSLMIQWKWQCHLNYLLTSFFRFLILLKDWDKVIGFGDVRGLGGCGCSFP